ncbi:MAG: ABC transporter ATP-binding protein [Lachnospiraceae bacterium]|nr:ABC transporter ATP-binding protein [Lachnospiraceae bacterium]
MICLKNIVKTYNKGKSNAYEALHGVSLEVKDGEMTAVIGTSGAGKSTLLHILACIDGYDSGEYTIDGEEVGRISERQMAQTRNEKIGMVMQDFALVEGFTALDNVLIPLDFANGRHRLGKKARREKALKMLDMVGMKEYAGKPVNNLSGGQKQRVAIARAIANDPSIILADEPTGALDSATTREIMDVFHELNEQGKTIIIVTHDLAVAKECGRVIQIEDGNIMEEA